MILQGFSKVKDSMILCRHFILGMKCPIFSCQPSPGFGLLKCNGERSGLKCLALSNPLPLSRGRNQVSQDSPAEASLGTVQTEWTKPVFASKKLKSCRTTHVSPPLLPAAAADSITQLIFPWPQPVPSQGLSFSCRALHSGQCCPAAPSPLGPPGRSQCAGWSRRTPPATERQQLSLLL